MDIGRNTQQQFGFTVGVNAATAFFFVGYDQHVFHEPTVVRFVNGASEVLAQPGAGPATPGDYEASDQTLVLATAAQLSQQAGLYPSRLLGNAGFGKVDVTLSQHNLLSFVNTSLFERTMSFRSFEPDHHLCHLDNGIEHGDGNGSSLHSARSHCNG